MSKTCKNKAPWLALLLIMAAIGCRHTEAPKSSSASTDPGPIHWRTIKLNNYHFDNAQSRQQASHFLQQIERLGGDVTGRDVIDGYFDVRIPFKYIPQLEALARQHRHDVWYYTDPRQKLRNACQYDFFRNLQGLDGYRVDRKYKTYDQIKTHLSNLVTRNSSIARFVPLGLGADNRLELFAIKLGNQRARVHRPRPAVLFNSLHHARELLTGEVAIDIVEYLLTQYNNQDEEVRYWLDHTDIWVVPIVNPSGYNRVFSEEPLWRKNWNPHQRTGVDINRNYGFEFGTCGRSNDDKDSHTYRGPHAFSEPETKIMDKLVDDVRPVMSVSYHSTGELVLFPYGCNKHVSSLRPILKYHAEKIARNMSRDCHEGHYLAGEAWDILYAIDGDDFSHFLDRYQVLSYAIELSHTSLGFQPPYDPWRNRTVVNARPSWQIPLRELWSKTLHGFVTDQNGRPVTDATVLVKRVGDTHPSQIDTINYTVNRNGSFFIPLLVGQYEVIVEAKGYHLARSHRLVSIIDCSFPSVCSPQILATLHPDTSANSSTLNVSSAAQGKP